MIFHRLSREDIGRIVDLQVEQLAGRVRERGIEIELTDDARTLLGNLGYDPTYGARPLKRVIQRQLVDKLALRAARGRVRRGRPRRGRRRGRRAGLREGGRRAVAERGLTPPPSTLPPMRIGICAYWFNRGQGVVARQLRSALDSLGHETFVLARPTRAGEHPPGVRRPHRGLGPARSHATPPTYRIPAAELVAWGRENELELAFFDQNYGFEAIEALRDVGGPRPRAASSGSTSRRCGRRAGEVGRSTSSTR